MMNAIEIIQGEHQRVGMVLQCLDHVLREIDQRVNEPDFELLQSIVYYISSYLFRFHHPKEDYYVYSALRRRYPPARELLDELEEEHRRGDQLIEHCRRTLNNYEHGGESSFEGFREAANSYNGFERDHMDKEEREILPLAREYLTGEDWAEIDAEFMNNDDPLFGKERERQFQKLFSKIMNLAQQLEFEGREGKKNGSPAEDI